MNVTARNLHTSPDGIYRKCVADQRACPYGVKADQHVSVVDLARRGGAVVAEGHGEREVSPIIEEGFWVKAAVRRRGFHEDGRPMKGAVFTRWLKRALASLGLGQSQQVLMSEAWTDLGRASGEQVGAGETTFAP